MRFFKIYLLSVFALFLFACSDDDEGTEYMFDREISEYSILNTCSADAKDSSTCFKIRYRLPIRTEDYSGLRVWLDTLVVDTATLSVSDKQIAQADFYEYVPNGSDFDTLDLTDSAKKYIEKGYDSLQVVMFCEYSDGGDPGAVQRLFLRFGDNQPPSSVEPLKDSVWSTGAMFEWYRPTDRADLNTPGLESGAIYGYNIRLWSEDPEEDIRDLEVTLISPAGVDNKGYKYYKRHAMLVKDDHSVKLEEDVPHKVKNYLHLVVLDGEGYDPNSIFKNRFRLYVEGLRTQSNTKKYKYTVAISAWDMAGNHTGSEADTKIAVDACKYVETTDSIAPLMPKKIFTVEDSLFPGFAKLDSNNRLAIFWSRSVDPFKFDHGIVADSELVIPKGCNDKDCYEIVSRYVIEYYNKLDKSWHEYTYTGVEDSYKIRFDRDDDGNFNQNISGLGSFVSDTIRWVAPGDTLILRIRAIDKSKYYSVALTDSIFVSPGTLADSLKCPEGFVAVSTSDTSSFCMERFEHRDANGKFMTNVLHSEAVAACSEVSASGFEVSLCKERDWELVCLSGGSLSYGVLEETDLFNDCNVSTNDSAKAADVAKRSPYCMNPMGVRDLPGQYQEWVMGRSEDTVAVLKGASYKVYEGVDHESIAFCTNRAFPYYTRPAYTQDTVYLYREGTKVDTVYAADTSRTLFEILTKKDFKDTLQFYDVLDANGKVVGTDYSFYSEYKKGGKEWLKSIANGLTYKPSRKEAVFLTGEKTYYREVASFYKSSTIGFRCCAYKK